MKRDWDKIRTILEKIETDELKAYYCESFKDLPEYKAAETEKEAEKIKWKWQREIDECLALLSAEGILRRYEISHFGSKDEFPICRMGFKGYDLLEILHAKYWQSIARKLQDQGMTYEGIMELHRHYVTEFY